MEIRYRILIVSTSAHNRRIAALFGNTIGEPGVQGITVRDDQSSVSYRLQFVDGFEAAFAALRNQPFQGLILEGDFDGQGGLRFLQTLSGIPYNLRHVTPRQVLLLYLGQAPSAETMLRLGKLNAGAVHVVGGGRRKGESGSIFSSLGQILRPRTSGKTAVCLAGGGIEGLIYETGVLRAIDEILLGRSVTEFDRFYGISAGAVVSSIVANGVPPSEIAKAFMLDSTVISPIKSSSLFDPAISEIGGRLLNLITSPADERGWLFPRLFSVIPSALFKGDRIEKMLEKGFGEVGRTNSFEELGGKLFIGATDQDTSEHIVFGTPGWEHVPISRAIHASLSLIPFYAPQYISGRWFIDGSFTRTSEVELAIAHGATLIVVVDPLIPVRAHESGYVRSKGGVFATIQSIKALVNTRFMGMLPHLVESHPEVDFLIFLPGEEDMAIMSGTLFKYRYRMEIDRIAYDAALETMRRDEVRVREIFARHGYEVSIPERSGGGGA